MTGPTLLKSHNFRAMGGGAYWPRLDDDAVALGAHLGVVSSRFTQQLDNWKHRP